MNLGLFFEYLSHHFYRKAQKEGYARVVDTLAASSVITWFASITGHANMFTSIEKYALFFGAICLICLASYFRKEIV